MTTTQRLIHAYDKDTGEYMGRHIATDEQFEAENDYVEGDAPVVVPVVAHPSQHNLTLRQFNHFAALWGYDAVIDTVISTLSTSEIGSIERALYAQVKSDVIGATVFHFDKVMDLVNNEMVQPMLPEGLEVDFDTMSKRWMEATSI